MTSAPLDAFWTLPTPERCKMISTDPHVIQPIRQGGAGGPSGPRTSVASECFLWTGFYSNFNVLSFRLPSRAPEPADARLKTMDMQMYQTALMIDGGIYSSIPSKCLLSVPDSTNPPISFFATAWCISPGALQQSGDLRISAPRQTKKSQTTWSGFSFSILHSLPLSILRGMGFAKC